MKKTRKHFPLSKTQSQRLGGLVQVLANAKPVDEIIDSFKGLNMVVKKNDNLLVTAKGLDETNRLSTLAGLINNKKKK